MNRGLLGGLSSLLRRLVRRRVPAGVGPPRDDDAGGAAGVREPRRPRPSGPRAGGAVTPEPHEPITARLPDPRR